MGTALTSYVQTIALASGMLVMVSIGMSLRQLDWRRRRPTARHRWHWPWQWKV